MGHGSFVSLDAIPGLKIETWGTQSIGRSGFVVSHPRARNKARGWGTGVLFRSMLSQVSKSRPGAPSRSGDLVSWSPTLAPEIRREDGAREFCFARCYPRSQNRDLGHPVDREIWFRGLPPSRQK